MSLEIILGDAGSGKSTALLQEMVREALAHPNKQYLLLVPEQFCLSTQRKLVDMHPRHALINIEALSFDRLAARAFRELRVNMAEILSETAKSMLLSLAVRDCKGRLQIYERQSAYPSFIRRLSSLLAEWTMNDLDPERIREIAGRVEGNLLRKKLGDLALLFEAYRNRLGEKQTAEEILPLFSRLLPRSSVGRADALYLDGFTGFTSVQYKILEQLMRRCPNTRVVLTLPPEEDTAAGRETELFYLSRKTVERLEKTAQAAGQHFSVLRSGESVDKKADLKALRTYLFRSIPQEPLKESPDNIHLYVCETPEEEAAWAADLIRYLARERGLRYRDMAVTVSDPNQYIPLLKREFREKQIPFFTDRREPLVYHPLIRLVPDALEAVSEGLPREKVLKLLKNPAGPLSREECDRFENYILAAGIRRGKDFKEPFRRLRRPRRGESDTLFRERAEQERGEAEALRSRMLEPLTRLGESLKGRPAARDCCAAVKQFLKEWQLADQLDRLEAEVLEAESDGASWAEALGQLDAFLANMETILGDTRLSRKEFSDMVNASLEGLSCGRLPMQPDQLIIGDVLRSRLGDIKTLIFLGMNEGLVPKARSESRLLTDHDRTELAKVEEVLGYTDQKALSEERFYLYCLLQKPTDSLYISHARTGSGEEKERLPAFILKEMEGVFFERDEKGEKKTLLHTVPYRQPENLLVPEGPFATLKLSPESVDLLYGKTLYASVTGLQDHVACPFRFFLQRGLGLEKRQELEWLSSSHGTLFHKIAELLMTDLRDKDLIRAELSAEEKDALVDSAMDRAGKEVDLPGEEGSPEMQYNYRRWRRFFRTYLDYLREEGMKDGFLPEAFEVDFGRDSYRETAALDLEGGRKLQLNGVLDRVDVKEQDGKRYLRVVDYKTYDEKFSLAKFLEGRQLQLPLYLDMIRRQYAAENPESVYTAGGIAYEPLKEQMVDWTGDPEMQKRLLWKELGLNGLTAMEVGVVQYNQDGTASQKGNKGLKPAIFLEQIGDYARKKAAELAEEIYRGDVTPAPWEESETKTSCTYCDFPWACPFRESKDACRYRIPLKNAEADLSLISGQEGEKESENKEEDHADQ